MKSYLPLIIGMTLVTYLPRLIPLALLNNRNINKSLKEFLLYIPYTSLSILIIRGILTAADGMKIVTVIGVGIAAIISYIKGNLVLSVLAGIILSFLTINTLV
ncbi:AzlD domain-containing protein [Tissierella sp. MB52-C2]|uniref:AzlD domain-containing protein n=1 Tax=Tissierella sp. MB52-C2 TaxID=3070999 RepID=UPI00280ABA12|nr:AzlD domain-containing protein [Tissierella sp. MB52-C2]WMM24522.1 AzlD domain-containing protein [Tissierella sp. MB52-C2]